MSKVEVHHEHGRGCMTLVAFRRTSPLTKLAVAWVPSGISLLNAYNVMFFCTYSPKALQSALGPCSHKSPK